LTGFGKNQLNLASRKLPISYGNAYWWLLSADLIFTSLFPVIHLLPSFRIHSEIPGPWGFARPMFKANFCIKFKFYLFNNNLFLPVDSKLILLSLSQAVICLTSRRHCVKSLVQAHKKRNCRFNLDTITIPLMLNVKTARTPWISNFQVFGVLQRGNRTEYDRLWGRRCNQTIGSDGW